MDKIFFDNWDALIRTFIIGVLSYATLILFLRTSGKRTLSKLNAFDFVVTVALGSTLASLLLNKDVSLSQGAVAFALLIGMQFLVTWSSVRIRVIRHVVTGEPSIIFYHGNYMKQAMRKVRVTESEVRAAIRSSGIASLEAVEAVVLETDGSLSVISKGEKHGHSSLEEIPVPTS